MKGKEMHIFYHRILIYIVVWLVISYPAFTFAGSPSKFSSVEEMIEEFQDYSFASGTFDIVDSHPLHIALSPKVIEGESQTIVIEAVDRALVYGIYRSFIHTHIDTIIVTAIPFQTGSSSKQSEYLNQYMRTISISRKDALALTNIHLKIKSFENLITEIKIGDMLFEDQWIDDFYKIYSNTSGQPGLKKFVKELEQFSIEH